MQAQRLSRFALALSVAAAPLAGCGGSQPPLAPGAKPQTSALATQADRGTSWMQSKATGSPRFEVLFSFGSSVNAYYGAYPLAGLIQVGATLYGTTSYGGGSSSQHGYGTVFSITPSGQESVLYTFKGGADGAFPAAGLVELNGWLYGTTAGNGVYGSQYGYGTAFRLRPDGSGFRTLHTFGGSPDGAFPMASLLAYKGKLYGTTFGGGTYGDGTVFSITPKGLEKTLYSFSLGEGERGSDGGAPLGALIATGGKLYGTTEFGGAGSTGTVFAMTTRGNITMLHSFGATLPEPRLPVAGVVAVGHTLYGTTYNGGANNYGSVFKVNKSGTQEKLVYSFASGDDGANPAAALTDFQGKLYGTTSLGGAVGYGTIFSVNKKGKEQVVHAFGTNHRSDGLRPLAALLVADGILYGTTEQGGLSLPSCPYSGDICDWGTVFAVIP
jgi:uncharacterized repeat protein (TIGR03803 family)